MVLIAEFFQGLSKGYHELSSSLTFGQSSLLNVFIFAVVISLYSLFTYKFYRYLSKKDLINLNLQQYNRTTHPLLNKSFAALLYLIEYVIVLPFLIFFWFAILATIILVLSEVLTAEQVIIVSAAMVAAVRMLAYYEEALSQDLAKIFPFTVLTIFIVNPNFFSLERILSNISEIPSFVGNIILFLVLIVSVELLLRFVDVVINIFRSEDEDELAKRKKLSSV